MRFTSKDFRHLRQAAQIADAQRELMLEPGLTDAQTGQSQAGLIAAALALIAVVTLASLTQTPSSSSLAYQEVSEQNVAILD
jgi:hypothetical protein